MRNKIVLNVTRLLLGLFLAGFTGCQERKTRQLIEEEKLNSSFIPEATEVIIDSLSDLDSFLKKGLPISEVVKALGSPDSVALDNGSGPGPEPGDQLFLWIYEKHPNETIEAKLTIIVRSKIGTFSTGDTVWAWFHSN